MSAKASLTIFEGGQEADPNSPVALLTERVDELEQAIRDWHRGILSGDELVHVAKETAA